ncbi:hypothetical protein [Mycoplasmopsis alligatoris]|uniref:Conserved domain protein n=1 Tax=Mycoplasmopsis alligatoris A21JP2 TaxID=747682 RepID=D4XVZ3_9BACT|nr:hypothetical protein [Mycoplasmopsis alligatoris]EFF41486.1 conserved domain protein [Mycoplasmopsis alligatoris A21JP2]
MLKIIDKFDEKEAPLIYQFLKNKKKTGFNFDYSPEIAKGRIITLYENNDNVRERERERETFFT